MVRLVVMPLVRDFGEFLAHPCGVLRPQTQLVFTRDYRIFSQFSHCCAPAIAEQPGHIQVKALPPDLKMIRVHEDMETEYTRQDDLGHDFVYVLAEQLKTLKITEDANPTNRAIKAYIDQLPDEMEIVLGWA